ncbi:unnamed protein product [Pseudo-nitzschia multistriata]|uniref:DnaJ homolog subfamily C member 2 n=1 Tax=Pseudo-nitzschia multistriata TaxID=183589 RepID=A0A448Z9B7_9STRA|nr:unnamed protein product [Pseudo-nitzschia multistriata]
MAKYEIRYYPYYELLRFKRDRDIHSVLPSKDTPAIDGNQHRTRSPPHHKPLTRKKSNRIESNRSFHQAQSRAEQSKTSTSFTQTARQTTTHETTRDDTRRHTMPLIARIADSLDWPESQPETVAVECAGQKFVGFYGMLRDEEKAWASHLAELEGGGSSSLEDQGEASPSQDSVPSVDLFSLSEQELEDIDFYSVLQLPCLPSITPEDVKKAYRKSCLKYHPDKSGRGEEDAVFLKVKAAFETLSTQKKAYDSTEMPFDDSIPSDGKIASEDFFGLFGPVFERNLHFDARLLGKNAGGSGRRNNRRKSGSARNLRGARGPPSLGDETTPIEEVHEFYDYWIHFESWRDFGLKAARELETQEHLENAESRYEKRWFQKEIDRAAKKLKQAEVARISTLVEKAMAADPRMIREKKRLIEEKEKKQRDRQQAALDKIEAEKQARLAELQKAEEEKKRKAGEKMAREQEKKKLRKAKQAFRKLVAAALEELSEKEHALEDEVDLICAELDRNELTNLNERLDSLPATEVVATVRKRCEAIRNGTHCEEDGGAAEAVAGGGGTSHAPASGANGSLASGGGAAAAPGKEQAAGTEAAPAAAKPTKKKAVAFTKEELAALAKAVKKFPAGGNRWDLISNYINNVCRPEIPRSKEECIEVFNRKPAKNKPGKMAPVPASAASAGETPAPCWTVEQDRQLQAGLSAYPSSMEKNERWSSIAGGVRGKSKKECVARFKEIRNALKAKK